MAVKARKVGQILINSILPEKYRDDTRDLSNKKVLPALLERMARELPPDEYRTVLRDIFRLGANISYYEGASFGLDDFKKPPKTTERVAELYKKIERIAQSNRPDKDQAVVDLVLDAIPEVREGLLQEAVDTGSGLAKQVTSGSRGKSGDLQSILAGDLLMEDSEGRILPFPVVHGYAEGITPAEYWVSNYGTRMGLLSTKLSTQDAGYACLAGDTRVRMFDGSTKPIIEIVVGDMVTGSTVGGQQSPTVVTAVFENGIKPVYEYTFRRGRSRDTFSIKATEDHIVSGRLAGRMGYSTYGEKRPLRDSKMCGFNLVSPREFITDSTYVNEPMSWIIGQLIGDGGLTGNDINWSSTDECYITRMSEEVRKFGCHLVDIPNHPFEFRISVNPETRKVQKGSDGKDYQNPIRKRLGELGLLGLKAPDKHIPQEVFKWNNSSVASLIAGIIESDGCVTDATTLISKQPIIRVGMTAKDVILPLEQLLQHRFGIFPRVKKHKLRGPSKLVKKANHPMYWLGINYKADLELIATSVLQTGRKADLLRDKLSEYSPRCGSAPSCRFMYRTFVGNIPTYDIEVANDDHLFVLDNGAIVSNSKRTKQILHDQVVTEGDCGTSRAIEVDTNDADNVGVVLAVDTDGYEKGTVLTPTILKDMKSPTLQVRSPVTCDARRGLCSRCLGIRETGDFANIGDNVGMSAAQSISERTTQQALCLHEGTLVSMADLTVKPIEDIVVGDVVIGSTSDGTLTPSRVLNTFNQGRQDVHRYSYKKGQADDFVQLECTEDHVILANTSESVCKGSVYNKVTRPLRAGYPASKFFAVLQQGLYELADGGMTKTIPALSYATRVQDEFLGSLPCYDIEIDHPEHLFLLANGMTVSNSKKHSAGRVLGRPSKYISGFKLYDQMLNAPSRFVDAAAVAPVDGIVTKIEKAPQGGQYIFIDGEQVHTAASLPATVKVGDTVEAGDILSDGIPNPSELVKHKGIGEGRRLFMQQMRDVTGSHRRNVEILGKGFVDFVKITDPDVVPNSSPDDILRYSELLTHWKPREGFRTLSPGTAVNQYLETPVSQYSVGTRITQRVAKDLKRKGIDKVDAFPEPPPFKPVMVPSVRVLSRAPDWQSRMGGYHIKESLLDAAARGLDSSFRSPSYIPALMKGTGFGDDLTETGNY